MRDFAILIMDPFFGILILIILAAVGIFLLLLPGIVARKRNHCNATAITVCQFFFWPVALIWAFTDNCEPAEEIALVPSGGLGLLDEYTNLNCPVCGKLNCADLSHFQGGDNPAVYLRFAFQDTHYLR